MATRSVSLSEATKALCKAEEFLAGARASLAAARWNAAGLEAIHAGIAAADAALIASAGYRSASQDHGEVVALLEGANDSFAGSHRRQLGGLLKMKGTVAYESRLLTRTDAVKLVDHAGRFVSWSAQVVRDDLR